MKNKNIDGTTYKPKLTKKEIAIYTPIQQIHILDRKGNLKLKFRREPNEET
jgi:hypothetical protein